MRAHLAAVLLCGVLVAMALVRPASAEPRQAWLGATLAPVDAEKAAEIGLPRPAGARITDCSPVGPALAAGLAPGDVILAIDGQPMATPQDVIAAVRAHRVGDSIRLTVASGTRRLTASAVLKERPSNEALAAAGDRSAMHLLANKLSDPRSKSRDDRQAVQWYRRAADAGYVPSMTSLGYMLENGLGTPRDDETAVYWYRRAADAGSLHGMTGVAFLISQGRGAPRNERQAALLYRKAAESGHAVAMSGLAFLLQTGRGVPKNLDEARHWYRKAIAAGDDNARHYLADLEAGRIPGSGRDDDDEEAGGQGRSYRDRADGPVQAPGPCVNAGVVETCWGNSGMTTGITPPSQW
jgi:TPR repeat protein